MSGRDRSNRSALRLLFAVATLLAAPLALAAETPAGTAAYAYTLGALASGELHGSCDARALVPPEDHPGSLDVAGTGAVLHVIEVRTNRSIAGSETGTPRDVILDRSASETVVPMTEGALRLEWVGRAVVFEAGAFRSTLHPFTLAFDGAGLRAGPARDANGPAPRFQYADGSAHEQAEKGTPGWSRLMEVPRGRFEASGDVSILLENARIVDGPRSHVVPPDDETRTDAPGLIVLHQRAHYAWLDVAGAKVRTDAPGTVAYCDAVDLTLHGTFKAFGARGTVTALGKSLAFDQRELALAGDLHIHDVTQTGGAREAATDSRADGTFTAVGLDFETLAGPGAPDWAPAAAATATGVLVVVAGAWLYTRIAEDRVLDAGERRRLYDAVVANPGIALADLQGQFPMSSTNTRYHLKLLENRGLVRVVRVQGRLHYMPFQADHRRARRELALSADPKLRDLLGRVGPEGVPASVLVEQLRATWGLSRTGSWKVLERAIKADIVERVVEDRKVILRPAS